MVRPISMLGMISAMALLLPFGAAQAQKEEPQVPWTSGPIKGALGVVAEVQVKGGCGFADAGGMYLEVTAAGGKYWRLKFRHAGKEKRLALGVYPAVTLAMARRALLLSQRFALFCILCRRRHGNCDCNPGDQGELGAVAAAHLETATTGLLPRAS